MLGSFLLARFRKGTPYAIKAERKNEAEALQNLQTFHTKLIEVLKRNKLDKPEHAHTKLIAAIILTSEFNLLSQANLPGFQLNKPEHAHIKLTDV